MLLNRCLIKDPVEDGPVPPLVAIDEIVLLNDQRYSDGVGLAWT